MEPVYYYYSGDMYCGEESSSISLHGFSGGVLRITIRNGDQLSDIEINKIVAIDLRRAIGSWIKIDSVAR